MMSELSVANPNVFSDFGLFGILKEVAVDDEGLLEFHDEFFPHPLYVDPSQQFYQALGNRKITKLRTWNPLRIYRGFQSMKERLSRKNISGNMKGEGLIQGGIIVFDQKGVVRAVYSELTGDEIPVDDILAALKAIQAESASAKDATEA